MRGIMAQSHSWTFLLLLSLLSGLIVACGSSTSRSADTCDESESLDASDAALEGGQKQFVEIGEAIGLREKGDGENRFGVFGLEEQMAGGITAFDFDHDGWEDLLATYPNREPKLLINECGRRFHDATRTWLPPDLGPMTTSLAADFTGDGRLDLFFGGLGDADDRLLIRTGETFTDRTFESGLVHEGFDPRPKSTFGATASDIDLDGDLDLFVSRWWTSIGKHYPSQLFLNDGTGRFRDITEEAGLATVQDVGAFTATFANRDADPFPELFVVADWGGSAYFDAVGPAVFKEMTDELNLGTDENGMGSVVEDLDGDSHLDWFVGSIYFEPCPEQPFGCTGNRLYRSTGQDSPFEDATDMAGLRDGFWSWGTIAADLNLDGAVDVVQVNGSATLSNYSEGLEDTPARYWLGSLNGSVMHDIAAEVGLDQAKHGRGLTYFDYDRDGDVDLVVNVHRHGLELYRNDLNTNHRWLIVVPSEGPTGIASTEASVIVTDSAAHEQRRDIRAGDLFSAQRPAKAYFGLGTNSSNVTVDVRWPDGASVRLTEQPIDRYLRVRKPDE